MKNADVRQIIPRRFAIWLFIGGMYLALYGMAGCQHSRWETRAQAARIVNIYHPWAIVLGLVMVVLGYLSGRRESSNLPTEPIQKNSFNPALRKREQISVNKKLKADRTSRGKARGR